MNAVTTDLVSADEAGAAFEFLYGHAYAYAVQFEHVRVEVAEDYAAWFAIFNYLVPACEWGDHRTEFPRWHDAR